MESCQSKDFRGNPAGEGGRLFLIGYAEPQRRTTDRAILSDVRFLRPRLLIHFLNHFLLRAATCALNKA